MTANRNFLNSPFLQLPGELRNYIYELVFLNNSDAINVADAFFSFASAESNTACQLRKTTAVPPSSALLRSCRQIYDESKETFATAYQRYWRKTFTVTLHDIKPFERFNRSVPSRLVKTFIVTAHTSERTIGKALLNYSVEHGEWYVIDLGCDHIDYAAYWPEKGEFPEPFFGHILCDQLCLIIYKWQKGDGRWNYLPSLLSFARR